MLCLYVNTIFAATPKYDGRVADNYGNPVEFANVTLLSLKDSTLIDGTITDNSGKFAVSGNGSPILLRITAMGFEDKTIINPDYCVGDIVLVPASYMLGVVEVKTSRPVAQLTGDGVHVDITGSYLANTGTALELLGKMPFVTKSDSDIEVLGKGIPLIYINGRQVRNISELDHLASMQIKSVDVVTNPGARYASTVNSVIRITTITPAGEGLSFNDRTTIGYKHYAYLFQQVNLNWRKAGFDLFGMLNYENYRERPAFTNSTVQYLKAGTVQQLSSGQDFAKYPVYQGKLGMNYNVTSHFVGINYDFSYKPSSIRGNTFADRYIDAQYSETLKSHSLAMRHNRQHLINAYYSGEIGQWQLSANFDALWQINDRKSAEYEASSINSTRDFTTNNDVGNRLIAGNITTSFPVWRGAVRFGSEVSSIRRTDKYFGNADYISDNDIKITETTAALFAETEQTLSAVMVNAGLRWEYTDSKYWQTGQPSNDRSRKYHNLAPSVSLSFPVGDAKARLSYMRKTSRPAFEQLSSAVKYIDRYSYESGNPNLKPIYRDYFTASASWRDVVVELEYYSTKDYFMWQTSEYAGNKDVTLLTMVNMPRFSTYGAYLNYAPTLFGCWHPSLMAGVNAQDFKIVHNNRMIELNKALGIFRFDNALHLPLEIWLNVDFSAWTSGNGDNCYIKPYWQCNLGLYKSFADDAWNVKLQLNDVFDNWRQEMILYDAMSRIASKKIYDTRDLSITVRYNFNSARSRYRGHGAGNVDKSRL